MPKEIPTLGLCCGHVISQKWSGARGNYPCQVERITLYLLGSRNRNKSKRVKPYLSLRLSSSRRTQNNCHNWLQDCQKRQHSWLKIGTLKVEISSGTSINHDRKRISIRVGHRHFDFWSLTKRVKMLVSCGTLMLGWKHWLRKILQELGPRMAAQSTCGLIDLRMRAQLVGDLQFYQGLASRRKFNRSIQMYSVLKMLWQDWKVGLSSKSVF